MKGRVTDITVTKGLFIGTRIDVTVRIICPVDTVDMIIALSDEKGDQSGRGNDEHTK